jgi:hypothetical protein
MNSEEFFDVIRQAVFSGKMSQKQVDGVNKILAYRNSDWPKMSDNELSYLLATVYHETAATMQPVTEYGSQAYLKSKKYWPWIGRGLIQITWKTNYAKYGITNPDDALKWPVSLKIAFDGMIYGRFTGKKLSDYITPKKCDFINARRIINGMDKAKLIAYYAQGFQHAFQEANVAGKS